MPLDSYQQSAGDLFGASYDRDEIPKEIEDLKQRGALFVCNHSGGKDSQAMAGYLRWLGIPDDQLVAIHADLGEIEWPGNVEHIRATVPASIDQYVVSAKKSFWDMVNLRQMFPDVRYRQCTSDLKRGPIEKAVRRYLKQNPQFNGMIVNCMGLRGQESPARAKRCAFQKNMRNSKAGRCWYDWLPIHGWSLQEVWDFIDLIEQKPHPIYAEGMSRLSCSFCIMASMRDLNIAARLRPDLYRLYVLKERELNHTLSMSGRTLEELTGIYID